jgi:uncharacterized protein YcbX
MRLGVVKELWRYPIKSMSGERVERTTVATRFGMAGDRGWAVKDEIVGEIRSAKRFAELLQCTARYVVEPSDVATPTVEITLPDGRMVRSDDPSVHALLTEFLGRPVTLWPRVSDTEPEHYLRREAIDEAEMRRQYGLTDDEPLPDMGQTPADILTLLRRYVSPPGTYFDAFELHLLATESLDALRRRHPDAGVDVRRFRPNVVVDTSLVTPDDFPEFGWVGHHVRIGEVLIQVLRPMQRCVMTVHAQGDLRRDRTILRTLIRETGQNLGVGATVVNGGTVAVGDPIELL